MSVPASFVIFGFLILMGAGYGIYKYRTPLNPLTLFSLIDVGISIFFAGIGAQYLTLARPYGSDAVVYTIWVSILYYVGGTAPYLLKSKPFQKEYSSCLHRLRLDSSRVPGRFSSLVFRVLIGSAILCFIIVAVFGGGGMLWLSNSREAYIANRSGVGFAWLLTQWFFGTATIYYLWTRKPVGIRLIFVVGIACAAASFTGSKGNVLLIIVTGITYYHFCVKKISIFAYGVMFVGIAGSVLGLMVAQGSYGSMAESLAFFGSGGYFDTTAMTMDRFKEFGFQYGYGYLSSLWFYVPRALYPNKPWEYGAILFYGTLFPGAAAQGYTPGYLVWTPDYIDFGLVGVLLSGLVKAVFQKALYEHFLKHRDQFFSFILVMQLSLIPVLASMSLVVNLIWAFVIYRLIVICSRSHRRAVDAGGGDIHPLLSSGKC